MGGGCREEPQGSRARSQGSRAKSQECRAEGYLTIFLALSLTAMLALFFVLLQGVRQSAFRMRLESVVRISVGSVLAEFQPQLHKQYDLFMIDTAYGQEGASIENTERRLRFFLDGNYQRAAGAVHLSPGDVQEARITQARYACDGGCRAVREQVYAYVTADPAGTILQNLSVTAEQCRDLESSGRDWKERMDENDRELKEALNKGRREAGETLREADPDRPGGLSSREEAAEEVVYGEESEPEQMAEEIRSFRFLPLLHQIFGDVAGLSDAETDLSGVLSHRPQRSGTGLVPVNSHGYPEADALLLAIYIGEKCRCFTDKEKRDGILEYEQEYILCGKASDQENLEGTAARLLLIREGANCLSLNADEGRKAQARAVASVVSILLFNPELEEPLTAALILGWAYLESIQDLRTLLAGGKIPLRKEPSEWRTSLFDLLVPDKSSMANTGERGLSYEQYLAGMMFLEGGTVKTQRMMDVMEMNVRRSGGSNSFRLDECIDALEIFVRVSGQGGYSCTMQTAAGYD